MKMQRPSEVFTNLDAPKIMFSGFDLSHRHTTTFDMGEVIPIAVMEVVPNDYWELGCSMVLRMQPLVAPILHPCKVKVQAWFAPYRLCMLELEGAGSWEEFITGGDQGTTTPTLLTFNPSVMPSPAISANVGSLWDRFGMNPVFDASATSVAPDCLPLAFPWLAYTRLWNDWFRIPGIQTARALTNPFVRPFFSNWPHDYYTAALPFLQRGISPSLPVLGTLTALSTSTTTGNADFGVSTMSTAAPPTGPVNVTVDIGVAPDPTIYFNAADPARQNFAGALTDGNVLDATTLTDTTITANLSTVDTKQIRLAFLYQAFLERMARGGSRYAEMLPNVWGAKPLDERLNRVEYIGGFTAPWITSEVLQTAAQTDNGVGGDTPPQGNMAGHGINLGSGGLGKYKVSEHGLILITACAYPDAQYQQGIPRAWLRRVREEFPSPSFAGLSEQEIFNAELFNQTIVDDPDGTIGRTPFGYTGRYNEVRMQPSIVTSEMRDIFDYWHLGRKFTSLPLLNSDFVNMEQSNNAENFKRVFAVQDVPGILATFGIQAEVKRPLPFMAVPAQLGGG